MTFAPTYSKQYSKINKKLFYIYLENERDIEYVDSCGYEPIKIKAEYTDKNGKLEVNWLYVVDTEKQNDIEEFYNFEK